MAIMNPVLRLRRVFRLMARSGQRTEVQADEVADEATEDITEYAYSREESDWRFEGMLAEMSKQTAETRQYTAGIRQQAAEMRQAMAEFRTQVLLAIFVAAGLIITAVGSMMTFID